jgi:hypothetical protein
MVRRAGRRSTTSSTRGFRTRGHPHTARSASSPPQGPTELLRDKGKAAEQEIGGGGLEPRVSGSATTWLLADRGEKASGGGDGVLIGTGTPWRVGPRLRRRACAGWSPVGLGCGSRSGRRSGMTGGSLILAAQAEKGRSGLWLAAAGPN